MNIQLANLTDFSILNSFELAVLNTAKNIQIIFKKNPNFNGIEWALFFGKGTISSYIYKINTNKGAIYAESNYSLINTFSHEELQVSSFLIEHANNYTKTFNNTGITFNFINDLEYNFNLLLTEDNKSNIISKLLKTSLKNTVEKNQIII